MIKHKRMELAKDYEKLHRENAELKEALIRANDTIAFLRSELDSVSNFFQEIAYGSTNNLKEKAQILLDGLHNDLYGQL